MVIVMADDRRAEAGQAEQNEAQRQIADALDRLGRAREANRERQRARTRRDSASNERTRAWWMEK